jgi:hypothetical protein
VSGRAAILVCTACVAGLAAVSGVRMTTAAFTASTTISGNTIVVDQLSNYASVAPAGDFASGDVNSLSVSLGTVGGSLLVGPVATVTAAQGVTLKLSLSGLPEVVAAVFDTSLSAQATLALGATARIWIVLSPLAAGHGSGVLRLSVANSTWLYRDYPLTLAAAPQAPG